MTKVCPPGFICMSNGLIITCLVLAFIGMTVLYVLKNEPTKGFVRARQLQNVVPYPPQVLQAPPTIVNVAQGDSRYSRAPQPLRDWMAPPEVYSRGGPGQMPINIPTQGLPESFQSIGLIQSDGQMLPLYGRRTAGSSSRWNYYTRTDTYNPIPIPLKYQKRDCMDDVGCNEVMSGDHMMMEGTGQAGKVTLYNTGGPRYIPGII